MFHRWSCCQSTAAVGCCATESSSNDICIGNYRHHISIIFCIQIESSENVHLNVNSVQAVAIEGASGALFGAPLVGYLAETKFGYEKTDLHMIDIPEELRRNNVKALGHALLCLTAIPWTFSFFAYGFVHLTYGPDRDKLRVRIGRSHEGFIG